MTRAKPTESTSEVDRREVDAKLKRTKRRLMKELANDKRRVHTSDKRLSHKDSRKRESKGL